MAISTILCFSRRHNDILNGWSSSPIIKIRILGILSQTTNKQNGIAHTVSGVNYKGPSLVVGVAVDACLEWLHGS